MAHVIIQDLTDEPFIHDAATSTNIANGPSSSPGPNIRLRRWPPIPAFQPRSRGAARSSPPAQWRDLLRSASLSWLGTTAVMALANLAMAWEYRRDGVGVNPLPEHVRARATGSFRMSFRLPPRLRPRRRAFRNCGRADRSSLRIQYSRRRGSAKAVYIQGRTSFSPSTPPCRRRLAARSSVHDLFSTRPPITPTSFCLIDLPREGRDVAMPSGASSWSQDGA